MNLEKNESNRHGQESELLVRDFQIKTLGRMTEGLINDFRNIFGIVVGYTEMAREGLPENIEIQDDLSEVLAACDRGKKLLNNINALCKNNQAGNINLDAERSIGATVNIIKAILPQNVTLEYRSTIDKSSITVDPMKLEQLLLGLCLALGDLGKVSRSKDNITITLGNKRINDEFQGKALAEGLYVQIVIESDEIGLDSCFIDEFNNHCEVMLLSSHNEPGAMLFAARRILLDLNGLIFLDSCGLNRTAISILFPVVDKSALSKPVYLGPPCGNGQRVLIVDDETQVADLTERRLKKLGYRVVTKTNSREALEYFANNSEGFSLLITDHVMPDLLGLDLAKEVLKIKPDIPIVMMAGYSSGITEKKCRESGIKCLAMKPIDEKELATIVADALR